LWKPLGPLGRRDSGAGGERHAGRGAARALPGAGAAVAAFPLLGIHHHRRLGLCPGDSAPRLYAVPVAVVVTALLIVFATDLPSAQLGSYLAGPVLVAPTFSIAAMIGIALPLFIVTMASPEHYPASRC